MAMVCSPHQAPSLYLHVPFCHGKCAYCAFYSLPSASSEQHQLWLDAIEQEARKFQGECLPLKTVFVGGGTPSVLSLDEWSRLAHILHDNFSFLPNCEWSCEANPESLSTQLLEFWRKMGVTRLSMGVQSFSPHLRKKIGRCGKLDSLSDLICAAKELGYRLNLDLIYQIPGETEEEWVEDLHQALEYGIRHLSCYALTMEEGSRLAEMMRNQPSLLSEEESDALFLKCWEKCDEVCADYGLSRYEISNFAVPGQECLHNVLIWRGGQYLGLGPAAASYDGVARRTNCSSLSDWLAGQKAEVDYLPPRERAAEILATGLRMVSGWDLKDFRQQTGFDAMEICGKGIERLIQWGLLEKKEKTGGGVVLRPTAKGLLFQNNIAEELFEG